MQIIYYDYVYRENLELLQAGQRQNKCVSVVFVTLYHQSRHVCDM